MHDESHAPSSPDGLSPRPEQLAEIVARSVPMAARRRGHPARRVFQSLRIAVNDELGELRAALPVALSFLSVGGVCAVISYHSGEDRLTKEVFADSASGGCVCPPDLPCVCGAVPRHRLVFRGSKKASAAEIAVNPRAEAARLRAICRIGRGLMAPPSTAMAGAPARREGHWWSRSPEGARDGQPQLHSSPRTRGRPSSPGQTSADTPGSIARHRSGGPGAQCLPRRGGRPGDAGERPGPTGRRPAGAPARAGFTPPARARRGAARDPCPDRCGSVRPAPHDPSRPSHRAALRVVVDTATDAEGRSCAAPTSSTPPQSSSLPIRLGLSLELDLDDYAMSTATRPPSRRARRPPSPTPVHPVGPDSRRLPRPPVHPAPGVTSAVDVHSTPSGSGAGTTRRTSRHLRTKRAGHRVGPGIRSGTLGSGLPSPGVCGLVRFAFLLAVVLLIVRLVDVQVLHAGAYERAARGESSITVSACRLSGAGSTPETDRLLRSSVPTDDVVADDFQVAHPVETALALAPLLHVPVVDAGSAAAAAVRLRRPGSSNFAVDRTHDLRRRDPRHHSHRRFEAGRPQWEPC